MAQKYSAHKHVYFLILNHTENTEWWFTYKATGTFLSFEPRPIEGFGLAVNLILNPKGELAELVSTHLTEAGKWIAANGWRDFERLNQF